MILEPGRIYSCTYSRWHNDRFPLLFVIYSDYQKTHGLNLHYVKKEDYKQMVDMFLDIQNRKRLSNKLTNNAFDFYHDWLKTKHPDIIKVAYRTYHSGLMLGYPAHPVAYTTIGYKWKAPINIPDTKSFEDIKYRARKDPLIKDLRKMMIKHERSKIVYDIKDYIAYLKSAIK